MNEHGKSDSCVVSAKLPNKGIETSLVETPAEVMERRQLAKGNLPEQTTDRTQSREPVQSALGRIRAAAVKNKKQKFTALKKVNYVLDADIQGFYDHISLSLI